LAERFLARAGVEGVMPEIEAQLLLKLPEESNELSQSELSAARTAIRRLSGGGVPGYR